MSILDKTTIKSYFETEDVPTEAQFINLIDSVNVPLVNYVAFTTTIVPDASTLDVFRFILTDDLILDNPINCMDGKAITFEIQQGASGNHTITLGSKYLIPTSATTPLNWSTTEGMMDILVVRYQETQDKFLVVSFVNGYNFGLPT